MRRLLLALVALEVLSAGGTCAFAQGQGITFDARPGPLLARKIAAWASDHAVEPEMIEIALVHLNSDQIPEVILRLPLPDGSCPPVSGCTNVVFADVENELRELARIPAHRMLPGKKTDTGHRTLLACRNLWDDFDCRVWAFNPLEGIYRPKDVQDSRIGR
ncbi:MAG: hypothetical protein EOM20_11430 [Spartobacteria bacterium]|nr:hypothetical protein [Spartobacteria bacterium]